MTQLALKTRTPIIAQTFPTQDCSQSRILSTHKAHFSSNALMWIWWHHFCMIWFLCIQDISVSEEPSTDQTDLSASSPPPYVPPPTLPLSDITAHEAQDRLSHSDVTDSLTNPVSEGQDVSATFEFDGQDGAAEDLSRTSMEQTERIHAGLEVQDSCVDQGIIL